MKLIRYTLAALLAAGTLAMAAPASATEGPEPIEAECATGWYVNPDETDRKPEPTDAGFKFEESDLMHRVADLPLADLEPGSYVADPAPEQPSFFSVEVRSGSGAYGTLRWNPAAGKWSITIGPGTGPGGPATAGQFEDANPVALLAEKVTKWGAFDPATNRVVSFGVGYTANPPSASATVVSEVSFAGTKYSLVCEAEESPSPDPTTPPAATASPTPGAVGSLPKTGPKAAIITGFAGALILAGVGVYLLARKRRTRFDLP